MDKECAHPVWYAWAVIYLPPSTYRHLVYNHHDPSSPTGYRPLTPPCTLETALASVAEYVDEAAACGVRGRTVGLASCPLAGGAEKCQLTTWSFQPRESGVECDVQVDERREEGDGRLTPGKFFGRRTRQRLLPTTWRAFGNWGAILNQVLDGKRGTLLGRGQRTGILRLPDQDKAT